MKISKILIPILLIITFATSCSESINNSDNESMNFNNDNIELSKIFPITVGNVSEYKVDTLNQASGSFQDNDFLTLLIDKKLTEDESEIFFCKQIHRSSGIVSEVETKLRITENSVELFTDTKLLQGILPDSLEGKVQFKFDEKFKLINFPYTNKKEWLAYRDKVLFGSISLNIFSISGVYEGHEELSLVELGYNAIAEKFKFIITMNIPDVNNPFISYVREYKTFVWLIPDIGIAKIEGCRLVVNSLTGRNFNLADSNKNSRHTLYSFNYQKDDFLL